MIFCLGCWLGRCEKNRLKVHQSLLENFSVRAKQKNKKPVACFMKLPLRFGTAISAQVLELPMTSLMRRRQQHKT